jgi:hypothetical protein
MNNGLSYGLPGIDSNQLQDFGRSQDYGRASMRPPGPAMNGGMPSANDMSGIGGNAMSPISSMRPSMRPTGLGGGGEGGWMDGIGGMEGLKSIGSGLQAAGNIYMAFQNNKLAKEQFSFQKDAYRTNLENESKSYNTNLAGNAKAAMGFEGKSQSEIDSYVNKNRI